jgi:hypothetical protein
MHLGLLCSIAAAELCMHAALPSHAAASACLHAAAAAGLSALLKIKEHN